jgi:hypothetical protein
MQVLGGQATPRVVGLEPLPGTVNYFRGNDPRQWRTNVSTYAKVEYRDVYPGINLDYYGQQGQLEYDFVVAAGADPSMIRLGFTGADSVAVNAQGDLVLHTAGQDILQHKPTVYQEVNGTRQEIASHFMLLDAPPSPLAPSPSPLVPRPSPLALSQVSFQLAAYDTGRPLVIDPVLSYSTYLGGSNGDSAGQGIAVDAAGYAYVTGYTTSIDLSADFPTTSGAFQETYGGGYDNAFVTKFDPTGSALVYSTYLGGDYADYGTGIAVDAAGNAYVTGYTLSTNFPTTIGAFQTNLEGGADAFVTKVAATGASLVYSTFLGGSGSDQANGIAVDAAGNAYVTGYTLSTNFPTTIGAFQLAKGGYEDAFVTKLDPSGSALVYSTYLGGEYEDIGWGIAVDAAGNAYVTGGTVSTDFPTTLGAFQTTLGGFRNAFVTKVAASGSDLVYSTYLGGHYSEADGFGIALDAAGNAYVTGYTGSDFPTTIGAFQTTWIGDADAFVTKVAATGASLVYSTFLGGSTDDFGQGIAVDAAGNAYVAGTTLSTDFPTTFGAFQRTSGGGSDVFVTKVDAAGASLVYSSYLGGYDYGLGIAVDGAGHPYVTGRTGGDYPTTIGAFQPTFRGRQSAFVTKVY